MLVNIAGEISTIIHYIVEFLSHPYKASFCPFLAASQRSGVEGACSALTWDLASCSRVGLA